MSSQHDDERLAASLHRSGRKSSARVFDATTAGTAIANDLLLFTCNPSDFETIDDLDIRRRFHTPIVCVFEVADLLMFEVALTSTICPFLGLATDVEP